ncbi:hypothetical protein GGF41_000708 [Coemansia sp. RSA 2531]|nr:hypothetical protein GGF41_000708 [Coemansia sp. RSA 2531]
MEVHLNHPKWVNSNSLPNNAINLVKKIHINVNMPSVASGNAYKLLVDYIGDTKLFPLANKLTVNISKVKTDGTDYKDTGIANALEFAELLKHAPKPDAQVCQYTSILMYQ